MNKSLLLEKEKEKRRHLADLYVLFNQCFVEFLQSSYCEELDEIEQKAIFVEFLNYVSITWNIDGVIIYGGVEEADEDEVVDMYTAEISFVYQEKVNDPDAGFIIYVFNRHFSEYSNKERIELQEYIKVVLERFLQYDINAILYLNRFYNCFDKKELKDVKAVERLLNSLVNSIATEN